MTPPILFNPVHLPEVPGKLYAYSLPGRSEPMAEIRADLLTAGVSRIVCLVENHEFALAPAYRKAIEAGDLPAEVVRLPIPDQGLPPDREAWLALAASVAADLRKGKAALVHCQGGHGRAGMFCIAVLMALGIDKHEAADRVAEFGGGPESARQIQFMAALRFQKGDA